MPLPELSDTMAQYLDNVKPLVSDVLYSETEGIVDKFSAKDGVGQKVMMVLEERPRIVASQEPLWRVDTRLKKSTGHCFHLQYKQ